MAKVKAGLRAKRGSSKRVDAKIIVHRTSERGASAFEACIRVGKSIRMSRDPRNPGTYTYGGECAYGKNPRKAVANAMKQYAKALSARKGAFRGVKSTAPKKMGGSLEVAHKAGQHQTNPQRRCSLCWDLAKVTAAKLANLKAVTK